MARPLSKISVLSSLLGLAAAVAIPATPVAKEVAKRGDYCAPTALGYVTPKPDDKVITVTKQGQPVYTCVPTAYACDGTNCDYQYSTSSYNWYSTYLPCADGVKTITDGHQIITLPGTKTKEYSTYTVTCPTPGYYQAGNNWYQVDKAPAYIEYVQEVDNGYATCNAHDYFQWYYGYDSSWGYGFSGDAGEYEYLPIEYVVCHDGFCHVEQYRYARGYSYEVRPYVLATTFSGYCATAGPCELFGFYPGFGRISININISIGGQVITTSTSITTSVTVTSTVTSTATVSVTTTASSGAAAPTGPATGTFNIAINGVGNTKRQNSDNYVGIVNGGLASVTGVNNAALFYISGGKLFTTGSNFVFATANDIAAAFAQIKVGSNNGGASTLFQVLSTSILEWRNGAFAGDVARYCLQPTNELFGVYAGAVPSNCDQVILVAAPAAASSSTSASASASATSSGVSSSATSAQTTGSSSSGASSAASSTAASSGASSGVSSTGAASTGASSTGASSAGASSTGASSSGATSTGASSTGASATGASSTGPSSTGASSTGASSTGASSGASSTGASSTGVSSSGSASASATATGSASSGLSSASSTATQSSSSATMSDSMTTSSASMTSSMMSSSSSSASSSSSTA